MHVLYDHCAGIDVHKKTVVVCIMHTGPDGAVTKRIETFATMTADLLAVADWLQQQGVTHLAMESTGVYTLPTMLLKSCASGSMP